MSASPKPFINIGVNLKHERTTIHDIVFNQLSIDQIILRQNAKNTRFALREVGKKISHLSIFRLSRKILRDGFENSTAVSSTD
jgi:hypothetical protein